MLLLGRRRGDAANLERDILGEGERMSKREIDWTKRTKKVRLCPKCDGVPKFLGVGLDFRVYLECPNCGYKFTGSEGKVVEVVK